MLLPTVGANAASEVVVGLSPCGGGIAQGAQSDLGLLMVASQVPSKVPNGGL